MSRALPNHLASRPLPRLVCAGVMVAGCLLSSAAIGQLQLPPQDPNTAPASSIPSGESTIEAYPLNASSRGVLTAWQQQAAGRTDVRVAIDERSGQALVFAPPAIHAELRRQLAQQPIAPAAQPQAPQVNVRQSPAVTAAAQPG